MKLRNVSLLLLAATIAVLAALGQPAYAEPAVIDDFEDNSIGDVWNETNTGTGASLSETNGRLEFHFDADSREGPAPPGAPFGDVSAGANHECKLTGDFDVRVDFDLTEWPEENGVRGGIIVGGVVSMQRDWDAFFDNVYTGGFMGTAFRTPTSDTSGTFRITREDSTVTASFASGGGWQTAASGVANEDPMSITLREWTHDHLLDARPEESKNDDVKVTLDNLNLEKGNLTCDEVKSVEFTQAIQELQTVDELMDDLEDDGKPPVPIIAGKPAAMRVYFDEVDQQTVRAVAVSGLMTDAKPVILMPGCDADKRRKQEGGCESVDFYFTPPDGDWSITLNVYDSDGLREHYDFELTSVEANGLILKAVSLCDTQTPGPFGLFTQWECESPAHLLNAASLLRRMFPTDSVAVGLTGNRVTRDASQFAQPIQWWGRVNHDLQAMYGLGDSLSAALGEEVYYFGVARNAVPGGTLGAAFVGTRGAASKANWSGLGYEAIPWVVAHETGHAMGLDHTNTAQPALSGSKGCWLGTATNLAWPWADNKLRSGPNNDDVEVGFDVANRQALSGDDYYDFSGYCSSPPPAGAADATVWISPFNMNQLLAPTGPLAARTNEVGGAPTSATTSYWLVGGTIDDQGQADFDPLVTLELHGEPAPKPGTHRLEVQDSTSGVLYTRMFTPPHGHGSPSPGDPLLNTKDTFSELIPVQQDAAVIEVFDAFNTPAGHIDLGGDPPIVTIEQPGSSAGADGTVDLSWSVDDEDSEEHTFWVDYSADGGQTWVSQAMGLAEPRIGLNAAMLAGSDNAVLRVIASDGVNSGMAVSAPFSVAMKLPEGEIIGPSLNVFRVGDLVWLEAAAWDVDDGTLDDASVTWNSNLDGALGTGASLPVYDLSKGTHTITMTAKDSDNNEVLDSIVVTVYDAPLVEGEMAIKGDLDCDDDVDSVDALKGLQHNAGIPVVQPDGCPPIGSGDAGAIFGDVDCDDDVDSVDSLSVLRDVAGLAAILPPGCKPIGI